MALQEFTVESRDIGTDGSPMLVTGTFDTAFIEGRVDEHYNPLDGIDYLVEQTMYDIETIIEWKLGQPPQFDDDGNEYNPPYDTEKWWEECHTEIPLGVKAEFENSLYTGILEFETHNRWGVTEGCGERAFASMIVSFLKDYLVSIVEHQDE